MALFQQQASSLRAFTEQTDKYKNQMLYRKIHFSSVITWVFDLFSGFFESSCYQDSWLPPPRDKQRMLLFFIIITSNYDGQVYLLIFFCRTLSLLFRNRRRSEQTAAYSKLFGDPRKEHTMTFFWKC